MCYEPPHDLATAMKPANIAYAADGVVKVLDFGIAQLAGTIAARQTRLPQTGMVLDTAAYLSPEQAMGAAAQRCRTSSPEAQC